MLAWNGAGKSNFSEIVNDGGYEVKRTPDLFETAADFKAELKAEIEKLESMIEKAF